MKLLFDDMRKKNWEEHYATNKYAHQEINCHILLFVTCTAAQGVVSSSCTAFLIPQLLLMCSHLCREATFLLSMDDKG